MGETYVLIHHGVKGMRWGVRKDAKRKIAAARGQRDISVAKAKTQDDVNKANAKYKREKAKIKFDMKRKLSDINNSPERIEAGRQASVKALKIIGGTAVTAASVAGAYTGIQAMRFMYGLTNL